MPRGRRSQYVRDNSGRFSSTPGGGPSKATPGAVRKAAKSAAMKGGTLAARTSLKKSKAKLATSPSPQQKGAVTRGQKTARAAIKASKTKIALTAGSRLRKSTAGKLSALMSKRKDSNTPATGIKQASKQSTAGKIKAAIKKGPITSRSKTAPPPPPSPKRSKAKETKRVNPAAERAKKMVTRTGVISGSKFESGQSVKTMSLKEMRSAVIKAVKGSGKFGMAAIANKAGTGTGMAEIRSGRMPRTRGEWEKAYRALVQVPMSEHGRKERPGVVNGIDIHKNFRPWAVFKLNPKTATKQDVEAAFRSVAKKVHPDVGGRRKDFERIKKMRDSVIALMKPAPAKAGAKKSKPSKKTTAKSSGPRLLSPSKS
jgi:hypothetical protein